MYWQSIFSDFIPTMQFVEKQHNLTLKALILSCFDLLLNFWEAAVDQNS